LTGSPLKSKPFNNQSFQRPDVFLFLFRRITELQRDIYARNISRRRRRRIMWVFYLISLPLTMGMVVITLKYFAGPGVPRYVLFTVGYTWFCSLSIIILVPADIWTVNTHTFYTLYNRHCTISCFSSRLWSFSGW